MSYPSLFYISRLCFFYISSCLEIFVVVVVKSYTAVLLLGHFGRIRLLATPLDGINKPEEEAQVHLQ